MTEALRPAISLGAYPDFRCISTADARSCPIGALVNMTGLTFATSFAWPTAKLVTYIPIVIEYPFRVQTIFWQNGTTPVGNIEVGVYDEAGTRRGTSGSAAAGTTAAIQTATPTAFTLQPARYYIAVTCDNVGGSYTLSGFSSAPGLGAVGSLGVMSETTGSFGLTDPWGTTAVFLPAAEQIPNVGIVNGALV